MSRGRKRADQTRSSEKPGFTPSRSHWNTTSEGCTSSLAVMHRVCLRVRVLSGLLFTLKDPWVYMCDKFPSVWRKAEPLEPDVMSRSALKSERWTPSAQNNITSRFKSGHLHPVREQHDHSFVVVFVSTWWVEVKYRLSFLALWEIFLLFSGQNFEVLWQTTGFVSRSLPLLLLLYSYSHA